MRASKWEFITQNLPYMSDPDSRSPALAFLPPTQSYQDLPFEVSINSLKVFRGDIWGARPYISSDRSIGSVYLRSHPPFGPFGASLSVRPGDRCGRVSKCPETVRLRRSETGRVRNPNVSTLVTSRNVWYRCFRVTEPLLVCYRYPWVTSPLGSAVRVRGPRSASLGSHVYLAG